VRLKYRLSPHAAKIETLCASSLPQQLANMSLNPYRPCALPDEPRSPHRALQVNNHTLSCPRLRQPMESRMRYGTFQPLCYFVSI